MRSMAYLFTCSLGETYVVHWLSGKARRTELMLEYGRTGECHAFYWDFFFFVCVCACAYSSCRCFKVKRMEEAMPIHEDEQALWQGGYGQGDHW